MERIFFIQPKDYHAGMPCYTTVFTDTVEANIRVGGNCVVEPIDSNGHEFRTIGRDEAKPMIVDNFGLN